MSNTLSSYVKEMRKQFGLTQVDLAAKSGVGLRFVRELEQGKETLRLDKVNQVLLLFGQEIGPVPIKKRIKIEFYETRKDLSLQPIRRPADGR
jgi:y4mF family transcriptional regulator